MNDIHPTAIVSNTAKIGRRVSVGAFSIVGNNAILEDDVSIGSHSIIGTVILGEGTRVRSHVELRDGTICGARCYFDSGVKSSGDVVLGDDVVVRFNTILARGVVAKDKVFFGPGVVTLNLDVANQPRGGATFGKGAFIGGGSVIHHGVIIGENVIVGSGAVVTRSLMDPGVYTGVPAKHRRPR